MLSWPLFDPTINARQRASRVAEEVRRSEIDLVRQQVVASVEQAYVGVVVAREALPSLQHELEAARANYAQADARFKAGLGTSVELADAEALADRRRDSAGAGRLRPGQGPLHVRPRHRRRAQ